MLCSEFGKILGKIFAQQPTRFDIIPLCDTGAKQDKLPLWIRAEGNYLTSPEATGGTAAFSRFLATWGIQCQTATTRGMCPSCGHC